MADVKMEAEMIFEPHVPNALRRALDYAGEDGHVASIAQLLHARDILDGKLQDGTEIPVYAFSDFNASISELPFR